MALSGALIQKSEDTSFRAHNSFCGPVHAVNGAIVGDMSCVFELALPYIKCDEEQQVDYYGCTSSDNEGGVIIDSPRVELARKNRKMTKRNKMNTVLTDWEIDSPASKVDEFTITSFTTEVSPCTFEALCDGNREDTTCSKEETEGVSINSHPGNFGEAFSYIGLSESISCKTMDIKFYCEVCGIGRTKSGCQCCNVRNDDVAVKSDAVNYGYHCQIRKGKENSPLNRQKSQRNFREGKLHWVSRLDCADMKEDLSLQKRNFCFQNNSFAGKVLPPKPMVSPAGHNINAACVSNRMANTERHMQGGFHSKVFFRHNQVPWHRLNGNHSQYFSLSNRSQDIECDKSSLHSLHSHVEKRFTRQIPRTNRVTDRYSDTSVDSKQCSRLRYYNEYNEKHVIPSGATTMWVPVCTKDSVMPENTYSGSVCNSYDIPQFSCNVLTDSHSKGDVVPSCGSTCLSGSESLSLTFGHGNNPVEGEAPKSEEFYAEDQKVESAKEDMVCTEKSRNVSEFLGSQMRTEESIAGQKLLLEYQSSLGHTIAEFERFLHSAAPVITSSSVYKTQLLNSSLHQTQIPTTSLQAVWQWYEMPGNYGLEVKARDSQKINGLLAESTSFCAYFVPYLSAVQLFGYQHLSDAFGKDHYTQPELMFEFFESEMPHLRKSLHLKIKDLVSMKTANLQVFGDPSKLESINLHDLHPTTWFSVAWYPIYRIPTGKFNASFLTYHSLSQTVVQSIPVDSLSTMSQIVFPVIGLQSYKTKGECWFDPRTPVESSSKETISEILKRLRTLEENALLLSGGTVTKENVNGVKRHPDYVFFTSQRR